MITKHDLLGAMLHECDVCIHLATKFTPEGLSYRPTPGQRDTVELMRYLAVVGIAATTCISKSDWKLWGGFTEQVKEMTAAEFPAAMQRQKEALTALFATFTEEQLATQDAPTPSGSKKLGVAIMGGPMMWMGAYKLQLFLYAKAAGAHDIGTTNAWRGVDKA
jgi:hypothetical protein